MLVDILQSNAFFGNLLDDFMIQVIDSSTLDLPMSICIRGVFAYLAANVLPVTLNIFSDCVGSYRTAKHTLGVQDITLAGALDDHNVVRVSNRVDVPHSVGVHCVIVPIRPDTS